MAPGSAAGPSFLSPQASRARAAGSAPAVASVRCSGRGRDTSLARIAALRLIFMAAMHPSVRHGRSRQKMRGHHGAGSQDMAADSRVTVPGRDCPTRPAAARVPSLVPPR
jgi:hypothetical protein